MTTSASNARPRAIGVAVGVECQAAAVEDQVVVAAELIDVHDRHVMLPRHAAEHLFAAPVFADRERRCRQIDDRVGARADQLFDRIVVVAAALPEVAIVPDVLADADAEPASAELEDLRAVVRLEVAVLVEHVVGGQQRLAKPLSDAARRAAARPC